MSVLTSLATIRRVNIWRETVKEARMYRPREVVLDPVPVVIRSPSSIFNGLEAAALCERDFGGDVADVLVEVVARGGTHRLGFSGDELEVVR